MDFLHQLTQGLGQTVYNDVNSFAHNVPQPQRQYPLGTIPTGQSLTPQEIGQLSPQMQGLANIYNQNPQDPRVQGIDPAQFGYEPDGGVLQAPIIGRFGSPNSMGYYHEPGIDSIGGRFGTYGQGNGQYGGTVGIDHGKPFANMNHNGQPTDPLTELRHFLGL